MNRLRNNLNKAGLSIMLILFALSVKGYEKETLSGCEEAAYGKKRVLNFAYVNEPGPEGPVNVLFATETPAGKSKRVGEVWTDCNGNGGYLAIPLEEMHANDQFIFKLISGEMEYVQVISRNRHGYWVTLYQGPRTTFRAGEFLPKLKPDITHLNFVVNSNHNFFRGSLPCRMELWHVGQGGSIPAMPPGSEEVSTADFDALLKKADEAFDRNYWDQKQGRPGMKPSNPKQESIDILKKAERIALQNNDPDKKYDMVKRLAEKYASYAKRVFAMSAKSDFVELAAKFLNRADDIRSAYPSQQDYKKKSKAYLKFAEGWRSVTKSALWGSHQYNKMYCDKISKSYYDKALQTDRKNAYLMRVVERINAPKKPVPPEIGQFEEIPPDTWNTAQDLMKQLNEGVLEQVSNVQENYLQIAETELGYSSGTVSIMRSGSKSWQVLPKNERTLIYIGDKIRTSKDAKGAYIYYASDNTKLNLRNDSEITFWSETKLLMERGGAYLEVNKRGEEFLVITPTCAVGVRGTALEVDIHPHKSTKTYLFSGVVEVRNNSGVEYVTPGNAVEANPDQGVMIHSAFDAAARKRKLWNTPEPENRDVISKHDRVRYSDYDHDHGRHDLDLNRSQVTFKTYSLNDNQLSQKINNDLNGHVTPVGLQMRGNNFDILYLNQDLFNISNWSMDWYDATSANEIKSGITSKMESGLMPIGFSSSNNRMYIFYAKGNITGQGWQLIESSQSLQQVAKDIEPYVSQDYLPVSISLYGQWYYTLLVRLPNSGFKTWAIQGYQSKKEMTDDIRKRAEHKQIPFGYLEEGGIHNVLFLGK